MKKPVRTLVDSGAAAICACVLTASQITAPDTVSSPRHPPPAVALTASATTLTVEVGQLFEHAGQFAVLIAPLTTPDNGAAGLGIPTGPAAVSASAAAAGPISYVFNRVVQTVAGLVFRLLTPALRNPALTPIVAPPLVFFGLIGGIAVAVVYSVISGIESAVATVIGDIGSALGGLLRLPTALLSGATAAAGLTGASAEPSLRSAAAFTADEHAEATAGRDETASEPDAPLDPRNAAASEAPAEPVAQSSDDAPADGVDRLIPDVQAALDEPEADTFVPLEENLEEEARLQPEPPAGSNEDVADEDVDVKAAEEKASEDKDAPAEKTSPSSDSTQAHADTSPSDGT